MFLDVPDIALSPYPPRTYAVLTNYPKKGLTWPVMSSPMNAMIKHYWLVESILI